MVTKLRAVPYFRVSLDRKGLDKREEDKLERQREQVERLAERLGAELLPGYEDAGVPGDEQNLHRRSGFLKLCRDAARTPRPFDIVLVDRLDRLSRQSPRQFFIATDPLARAGVRLCTAQDGEVSLDDFDANGQVMTAMRQGQCPAYVVTMAGNILSKSLTKTRAKKFAGGRTAYGYVRGEDGRLAIDRHRAEVVRWIFESFADRGLTIGDIIKHLKKTCQSSPTGGPVWSAPAVLNLLRNTVYRGTLIYGRRSAGKHAVIDRGQSERRTRDHAKGLRPESEWIVVEQAHDAIIEQELFDKVQQRLAGRRTDARPAPRGDSPVSGLCCCGMCGHTMIVRRKRVAAGVKELLVCGLHGSTVGHGCGYYTAPVGKVLARVIREIQKDAHKRLDELKELVREEVEQQRAGDVQVQDKRLRSKLAAKEKDLDAVRRQWAVAEGDDKSDLHTVLVALRGERNDLQKRIAETARRPVSVGAAEEYVKEVENEIWRLDQGLESEDPAEVRAILRDMVHRIELFWEPYTDADRPKARGAPRKHRLARGVIHLKPSETFGAFGENLVRQT